MTRTAVFVISFLGSLLSGSVAQQTCYARNQNPYRLYSSLTTYRDHRLSAPQSSGENTLGCQPVMLFMLARNGIRTPTQRELNNFETRLPVLQNRILQSSSSLLCQEDLDALGRWNVVVNASTTDLLTLSGENEAKRFAERMRVRFPSLLSGPYLDDNFLVRHVYRSDRANTATAFVEGLGFNASVAQGPTPDETDLLLQFSANCNADDNDVEDDDILEDFLENPQVQSMIASITQRLGLEPNSLSLDDIDAMYKMCAYDYVMNVPSPWCAAFQTSDLQLLELKEDLIHAELYGYNDDINQKETCILLKDFVGRLNDRQQQFNRLPAAVMYFAQTDTLLPFVTSLGLFKDDEELELDDDESPQSLSNRQWRTSLINPFMANVAVVMYQCPQDVSNSPYHVRVLVNEETLPLCGTTICPVETLMEKIEDFAEECSFEELCDGVSTTAVSYSVLFSAAFLSLLYACLFS